MMRYAKSMADFAGQVTAGFITAWSMYLIINWFVDIIGG
jgi:hypothetical protein